MTQRYTELNFSVRERVALGQTLPASPSDDGARVLDAWIQDAVGARGVGIAHGTPCALFMHVQFLAPVCDPVFTLTLEDAEHRCVMALSSEGDPVASGDFEAGETISVGASFDLWLAPGRYELSVAVLHAGPGRHAMASAQRAASVVVTGGASGGVVTIPHAFFLQRIIAADAPVQRASR